MTTSFGVPQVQALVECRLALDGTDVALIADGGIRRHGALAEALLFGGDCAMLGSAFAGTEEAPGEIVHKSVLLPESQKTVKVPFKVLRGMASLEAIRDRLDVEDADKVELEAIGAEGMEISVPARGSARTIVRDMIKHLCSSISYGGAASLSELRALFWADPEPLPDPPVAVGPARVVRAMTLTARADPAAALRAPRRCPANVAILQRFFKTGPGEYGEGDVFIGVKVAGDSLGLPRMPRRADARDPRRSCARTIHEERLLALLMLVDLFATRRRGGAAAASTSCISATPRSSTTGISSIRRRRRSSAAGCSRAAGRRSRSWRDRSSLWERRIAIVATHHFIRRGELDETFRIADLLLRDEHDLIHKAVGWMLREAGKRDGAAERRFLAGRYETMPRTMLRYAIERFPEAERKRYLAGRV